MPTFHAMRRSSGRSPSERVALAPERAGGVAARGEEGFLLIEVIISAVLVALIVVATFTGFDVVNRTNTDQRERNQAIALAAQSQEQLRSDPASRLETLEASPSTYTQTLGGITYTIKQSAKLLPSGGSAACNVTETSRQTGNAFSIASAVTWPQQERAKRPGVTAASTITPPTGSALEVDAYTGPGQKAGIAGITAYVTYTPVGSSTATTLEQTTGSNGCVVFSGIPATHATVQIKELPGYVTTSGAAAFPGPKEVTLAPNYTTHYPVVYDRAGAIKAKYEYAGATTRTHESNEETGAKYTESVSGDTFVAFNSETGKPAYELGSTTYGSGTSLYEPLTGTFEATATSKTNLFPFPAEEEHYWRIYAGDCTENDAENLKAASLTAKVVVKAGEVTEVVVPTSLLSVNVYVKTQRETSKLAHKNREGLETAESFPATVTNSTCAGTTPANEIAATVTHTQQTTVGAADGGHLSAPFQPFGKEMLLSLSAKGKTFTTEHFNLNSEAGATWNIYLGQPSPTEKAAFQKAEEEAQKKAEATRIAEETKKYKEPREKSEKETKEKEAAREAAEQKKWEEEYKAKKISKSTYNKYLSEQASKRTAREAAEASARTKAESEESSRASSEKTKELAAEAETRKKREEEEAKEAETTKVTVS